jgi:hypothetical protein
MVRASPVFNLQDLRLIARPAPAPTSCCTPDRYSFQDRGWRVHRHDWLIYTKEPLGGSAQVLDYLGRYTHRVAISNERILGISADAVSVRVRDWTQGNRRRTLSVPAQTFIERFLLHVLPKGFKRIRHYGLIGPAHKAARLAAVRLAVAHARGALGPLARFARYTRSLAFIPALR